MGFFDASRARNDERIKAIAREHLRKGEKLLAALLVTSRMKILLLALAVFPGSFFLEVTGRGSLSPLLIGLSMAAWFGIFVRQHFLVLTNQRVVSLRLARFSTKKIDHVSGCERPELKGAEYKKKLLSGFLTLTCGEREETFQVARIYEDRAKELVRQIS